MKFIAVYMINCAPRNILKFFCIMLSGCDTLYMGQQWKIKGLNNLSLLGIGIS